MCGIAGISTSVVKDPTYWKRWASRFSDELKHRGKDDAGLLLMLRNSDPKPVFWGREVYSDTLQYIPEKPATELLTEQVNGFILHQRLSIIAPGDRGHQPMCDATGRYWITFNGEIFNYIELRKQYKINTITDTDTEVLLELWAKMEDKCLQLLDGFFAFCIYDSLENTYTLVRDKTGVKPLFYLNNKETFAFSSEEQTLREINDSKEINPTAIYLHLKYSMTDAVDWYPEVKTLKPGCWIRWIPNLRSIIDRQWYYPSTYQRLNEVRDLRELLFESMRKRLRSDVPMGFAVSGGIDSSIILGIGRWQLGMDAPLHLFSVGSNGMQGDETDWQKKVQKKHGGQMHQIRVEDLGTPDFEQLVQLTKRPPVAWNNIGHFALCRKVREVGVTVLFNGQGADEIFGGYPDYFIQSIIDGDQAIKEFKDHWPIGYSQASKIALKRKWRGKMSQKFKHKVDQYLWGNWFNKVLIFSNDLELHPVVEDVRERMLGDYYGTLQDPKFYGRLYQMLAWEDRNGMAFQLESRNPFADDLLLPKYFLGKYSLNALSEGGMPKGMLRNTFKDLLPNDLFARLDKKGFSMPEAQLTQKFGADWKDWFLSSKLDNYINRQNREKMVAKFSQLSTKELSLYFKISSLGLFLENQGS